jgi:Tfp pilus assembly protein PilF
MVFASLLLVSTGCFHRLAEAPEILQQRYEACMDQGSAFLVGGDYGQAAQVFEEAIRCVPGSSKAHALLGFAYLKLRKNALAEQVLLKAVALDPGNVAAFCNLGVISVKNQNYREARARLERAVALDPGFALAQFSLGNLLMHMGDVAKAQQVLARAFELDPRLAVSAPASTVSFQGDPHPLGTALGFIRVYASAGNLEETLRFMEEARRLGFKDWRRLLAEADFDKVRDQPKVRAYLD